MSRDVMKTNRGLVYKTLNRYPGCSLAEVISKAKLNPKSGSIAVYIWAGVQAGLIKQTTETEAGSEREINVYALTAKGKKHLADGLPAEESGVSEFNKKKGWGPSENGKASKASKKAKSKPKAKAKVKAKAKPKAKPVRKSPPRPKAKTEVTPKPESAPSEVPETVATE